MRRKVAVILLIALCAMNLAACNQEEYYEYEYPEYWSDDTDSESVTENTASEETLTESVESESQSKMTAETTVETTVESQTAESETTESLTDQTTEIETHTETKTEIEISTENEPIHIDLDENNYCDICGELIEAETAYEYGALFDAFYDEQYDLSAKGHSDGSKMTEQSDTYIRGSYELTFLNYSYLYKNARDAKGNSALKLGTTSSVGSFELNIPEDISIVVIMIAKYKDRDSAVLINNVEHVLINNSNAGEYDRIIIDATRNKLISVSTTDKHKICMIRSIEFVK